MKAVILAGGLGTRFSEETVLKPKPMIEIGERPILWHIMKMYSQYNINEFIVCLGYKGYLIKEYFANYFMHRSDIVVNTASNNIEYLKTDVEQWKITLVDTGLNSMTGHRLKRVEPYINETFMLTYGDGVSDININKLHEFHKSHNGIATLTSIRPEGRFGALEISDNNKVINFMEKPKGDGSWVNGGFFVFEKEIFNYLNDDANLIFEREPLERVAQDGKLFTYKHDGFWKCMDTARDKARLEELWKEGAPWKTWN